MHMNGRSVVGEVIRDSDVCYPLKSSNNLMPYPYTYELNLPSMPLHIISICLNVVQR
jgi:hypothetical protein